MLATLLFILLGLWVLALVTSQTMGGLIHVLLLVAIIVILYRMLQGRRVANRS